MRFKVAGISPGTGHSLLALALALTLALPSTSSLRRSTWGGALQSGLRIISTTNGCSLFLLGQVVCARHSGPGQIAVGYVRERAEI